MKSIFFGALAGACFWMCAASASLLLYLPRITAALETIARHQP